VPAVTLAAVCVDLLAEHHGDWHCYVGLGDVNYTLINWTKNTFDFWGWQSDLKLD